MGAILKTKGTMSKKDIMNISVQTLPNGYALTVDEKEYMCFNVRELSEAVFVHCGLERTEYMDRETIQDLMTAAATWPNAGDAVQQAAVLTVENDKLNRQLATLKHKLCCMQDRLDEAQDKLEELDYNENKPKKPVGFSPTITKADVQHKPKTVKLIDRSFISKGEVSQGDAPAFDTSKFDAETAKELLTPISRTGLSTRAKSVLSLVGGRSNKTVGDALRCSRKDFLKVRGCGVAVISDIEIWLTSHGLTFGMV